MFDAAQASLRDNCIEITYSGNQIVDKYCELINKCARENSKSYDEWQDLAAETRLALLSYPEQIKHPAQFIRIVTRNIAINRKSYGCEAWETPESEFCYTDESTTPLVEFIQSKSQTEIDPMRTLELRDTLLRMEERLTASEKRCYQLLKKGFEQEDLARLMGISKQAVSKLIMSIRRKFLTAESE